MDRLSSTLSVAVVPTISDCSSRISAFAKQTTRRMTGVEGASKARAGAVAESAAVSTDNITRRRDLGGWFSWFSSDRRRRECRTRGEAARTSGVLSLRMRLARTSGVLSLRVRLARTPCTEGMSCLAKGSEAGTAAMEAGTADGSEAGTAATGMNFLAVALEAGAGAGMRC